MEKKKEKKKDKKKEKTKEKKKDDDKKKTKDDYKEKKKDYDKDEHEKDRQTYRETARLTDRQEDEPQPPPEEATGESRYDGLKQWDPSWEQYDFVEDNYLSTEQQIEKTKELHEQDRKKDLEWRKYRDDHANWMKQKKSRLKYRQMGAYDDNSDGAAGRACSSTD